MNSSLRYVGHMSYIQEGAFDITLNIEGWSALSL